MAQNAKWIAPSHELFAIPVPVAIGIGIQRVRVISVDLITIGKSIIIGIRVSGVRPQLHFHRVGEPVEVIVILWPRACRITLQ